MITQVPDNHSGAWGQFGAYSCVSVLFHIGCSRIPSLFTLKYLTNLYHEYTGPLEQRKQTAELTRSSNSHSLLPQSIRPTYAPRSHQAHLASLMASKKGGISA